MRVTLFHAERILDGSKTALLMPAIPADRYRTEPDGRWYTRDQDFEHNRPLVAVRLAVNGKTLAVGDHLPIRALPSREQIEAQVTEIRMVECARLSDGDIEDLGYPTRAAYMAEVGRIMSRRKAWFVRIIPLPETAAAL